MTAPGTAPVKRAVDTSLAVPLLALRHDHHAAARAWARGKELWLAGHAAVETYSVLTRLPGSSPASPRGVADAMDRAFLGVAALPSPIARRAHQELAAQGIAGGAVYDGLVALAARAQGLTLATRDARAAGTYSALGVAFELVALR
ncbi:MAG: PIN domain-containing protein [Bifidobacteriaceae bacterium]|jgi:predicted nucleic acid-binding protein|nr:PIN domain-containing protein [Bifidobacteriaceae bacterium]